MVIEILSHSGQNTLSDEGLNQGDQVLQSAGRHHRYQIDTAVHEQQIGISELNGFIDNPFLHLQRQYPGKNGNDNDQNQKGLKLAVSCQNP